ncbi:MAG: BLUF domain-containing protein [Janthinobacterium lividum]
MNEDVYRLLYCSRNTMTGSLEEQQLAITQILAKSRTNNSANGITGALLFNSGFFAQVLEGPLPKVEQTFERIQRDMRHDEISVLECTVVPSRDFPEWSMAFAGGGESGAGSFADMSIAKAMVNQSTAAAQISELLRALVVQEDDYATV